MKVDLKNFFKALPSAREVWLIQEGAITIWRIVITPKKPTQNWGPIIWC